MIISKRSKRIRWRWRGPAGFDPSRDIGESESAKEERVGKWHERVMRDREEKTRTGRMICATVANNNLSTLIDNRTGFDYNEKSRGCNVISQLEDRWCSHWHWRKKT